MGSVPFTVSARGSLFNFLNINFFWFFHKFHIKKLVPTLKQKKKLILFQDITYTFFALLLFCQSTLEWLSEVATLQQ